MSSDKFRRLDGFSLDVQICVQMFFIFRYVLFRCVHAFRCFKDVERCVHCSNVDVIIFIKMCSVGFLHVY